MPSGFAQHNEKMYSAIMEAIYARILVFAAASNYGNLASVAFPAHLYTVSKVFCMFSTTAEVKASPWFNPTAIRKGNYNFAILGHNVILPPLKEPVEGTSVSTMIGAALAARILDFSRHPDTRAHIKDADHLKEVEGMSEVFAEMVDDPDNGYHCMAPWKLLPEIADRQISEARIEISRRISNALAKRYKSRG
jgi:hypothetical protein